MHKTKLKADKNVAQLVALQYNLLTIAYQIKEQTF